MTDLAMPLSRNRATRLLAFAIETHPPAVYALVCWGWAASLMGMLAGGAALPPSALAVGGVFFLILLYLRAIDEIKDLPYDRLHHPDRPVVRGAVSVAEVAGFAALVAGVVVTASAWLSPWLALLAACQLAYGVGLLALERHSRLVRESILLNLAVTFPVSAVLNGYVAVWLVQTGVPLTDTIPSVLAHLAIFLHMEFGRKLVWPGRADPGENSYAMVLGARGAAAVCAMLGIAACALATTVHLRHGAGGWSALPWLAMLPSCVGFVRFWHDRDGGGPPRPMKPWFGGAMILFFAVNAAVGLGR